MVNAQHTVFPLQPMESYTKVCVGVCVCWDTAFVLVFCCSWGDVQCKASGKSVVFGQQQCAWSEVSLTEGDAELCARTHTHTHTQHSRPGDRRSNLNVVFTNSNQQILHNMLTVVVMIWYCYEPTNSFCVTIDCSPDSSFHYIHVKISPKWCLQMSCFD